MWRWIPFRRLPRPHALQRCGSPTHNNSAGPKCRTTGLNSEVIAAGNQDVRRGAELLGPSQSQRFLRSLRDRGDHVEDGENLAVISDPFGKEPYRISAEDGIIIGVSTIPLVNRGDAMVHIATFSNSKRVRREMELADEDYF